MGKRVRQSKSVPTTSEEGRESSAMQYMTEAEFTSGVLKIFEACRDLSRLVDGIRPFTPDGRLEGRVCNTGRH